MKASLLLATIWLLQLAEQTAQTSSENRAIMWSTIIIAGATTVNVFLALLLWKTTAGNTKITRDIFEASHRPYVCVASVDYVDNTATKQIEIIVHIKNVGSVPAHNVKFEHDLLVNGNDLVLTGPKRTLDIFPATETLWKCSSSNLQEYEDGVKAMLEVCTTVDYIGLANIQYHYQGKAMRPPNRDVFTITESTST